MTIFKKSGSAGKDSLKGKTAESKDSKNKTADNSSFPPAPARIATPARQPDGSLGGGQSVAGGPARNASHSDAGGQQLRAGLPEMEFWGKIAKAGIYFLVFLVPLFFLPWTANTLDFNKQALVGVLVFIVLLAWILRVLVSAKLELNLNPLIIPIVILLLIYTLSTIFSVWPYGSFWGWPLNVSAGLLTLLYFVILYFLISNIFAVSREDNQRNAKKDIFSLGHLLFILVFSGFLAALFGILQLFGKFIFPWDFTKLTAFNTVGTVNSLAVFLAILLPLAVTLIFAAKRILAVFLAFFGLVMLAALVVINFWVAWVLLIAGAVILFIFGMSNLRAGLPASATPKALQAGLPAEASAKAGQKSMHLLQLSLALLVVASFFVFFKPSIPGLPATSLEVSLKQKAEIIIAKNSLEKRPLLGTGPGAFVYDFAKFKPQDLNQTIFWNIRFGSGASEALDKLITTGLLGIVSLLLIFGMFLWNGFKCLTSAKNRNSGGPAHRSLGEGEDETIWFLQLGVFTAFAGSVLAQFLYPANFSLTFLFWLTLALLSVFGTKKIKSWEITPASPLAVGASFVLVVAIVFSAGFFFVGAQKYRAEMKYLQGLKVWQESQLKTQPLEKYTLTEEAISRLLEATRLNPNLDIYWRDLSQLYLIQLNDLLQRQDLSREEVNSQGQTLVREIINSTKQTTDLNPENVANWNVRGFVYRNMIGVVGGTADWALGSYQRAAELEPANPYIYTEIGRIFVAKYDIQEGTKEENIMLARQNFEKSIQLKEDYAPARFQIAMTDVREGKIKEAIEKLEATKQVAPSDTGLAFQLGVLYYQDNQFDKAKAEFERAIRLDENYSNARYLLGLIYDREGNKQAAIEQFEKIGKLNPANEEIKKILANLREGKSALEGIQPAQPPIEEKPAEIEKKK